MGGADNRGDYVTIVRKDAPADSSANYQDTKKGASLELTAPIEPGAHEVRYVTGRSHTILGRAAVEVVAAGATLEGPAEVVLGATFSVAWTGPNNKGDFVTVVPRDAQDAHYGSYTDAEKPSPQTLTAPTVPGDAELRYVARPGNKVLARRPIKILAAEVALSASADASPGPPLKSRGRARTTRATTSRWLRRETPDGQYGNYTDIAGGSPLKLLIPIMVGDAELRYMTGQDGRVLGRRPIKIVAAEVTLSAPTESAAGSPVSIKWTGPNNPGDYITVVAKGTPDGQYGKYTLTASGSPLSVTLPKETGDGEVRYMAGQGNKVLARIPIKVIP
jgi:hypothetical protein